MTRESFLAFADDLKKELTGNPGLLPGPGVAEVIFAAKEIRRLEKALRSHECPGDGSIDQECYVRIMEGGKCSATEALGK